MGVTSGGDMRERVGQERTRHERAGNERVGRERWAWRVGSGPRPVRPGVAPASVRPPEAPRPAGPSRSAVVAPRWVERIGLRLLTRRRGPVGSRPGAPSRVRRAAAGLALVAASTVAVLALGLLVRAVAPATPTPVPTSVTVVPPAPPGVTGVDGTGVDVTGVDVTAEAGDTVWEVVDRVAPGASGAERAALAERIVVDNGLDSVRLRPGQVLHVSFR